MLLASFYTLVKGIFFATCPIFAPAERKQALFCVTIVVANIYFSKPAMIVVCVKARPWNTFAVRGGMILLRPMGWRVCGDTW